MHTKKENTYQSTHYRTYLINAINHEEAMALADDIANNYTLDKPLIKKYNIEDISPYPLLPQTTNSIYGYEIKVARIRYSTAKDTSEATSNYIITDCEKQDKPYFYCHSESTKSPPIKTSLLFSSQKNGEITFHKKNLLALLKQQYNSLEYQDETLCRLINSTIKTDYEINSNHIYEGVITRSPRGTCIEPFIILLMSDKKHNIIINENMIQPIQNNQYLSDIIIQYTYDLLDQNITSNVFNKKSLKI